MTLKDFNHLPTKIDCGYVHIKSTFPKSIDPVSNKELRIYKIEICHGSSEGVFFKCLATTNEENEFLIIIKLYGFKDVVKLLNYLKLNCQLFDQIHYENSIP